LTALAVIVDNFDQLAKFAAGITRLDTFAKALAMDTSGRPKAESAIETVHGPRIVMEHVTLQTPDNARTLVTGLSLAVDPGRGLIYLTSRSGLAVWISSWIGRRSCRSESSSASPSPDCCSPDRRMPCWTKLPVPWISPTKNTFIGSSWRLRPPLSASAITQTF